MRVNAKSVRMAAWGAWLGLAMLAGTPSAAFAAPPKAAPGKKAPAAKPEEPAPNVTKPITVAPKEILWGIGHKQLEAIYDKVIDNDYKDKYKHVEPGPEMEALDAEVAEKKDVFRRSRIDFGNLPTGLDGTPLKTEYSYNNKESLMQITRGGKTRDFFFIQDRLWKIIEELPLGDRQAWGNTFADAVTKLAKYYGVAGRVRDPDPSPTSDRQFTEVDWKDAATEVRADDWQNGHFALAFVDAATHAQLGSLRSAKAVQSNGVDPTVQDVLKTPSQPPELKDKGTDKDKKGGKGGKGAPPAKH